MTKPLTPRNRINSAMATLSLIEVDNRQLSDDILKTLRKNIANLWDLLGDLEEHEEPQHGLGEKQLKNIDKNGVTSKARRSHGC